MNRTRIAFGITLVTLLAFVATDASARERVVKRTGAHGGGYTKTVETQRTEDGYSRQVEGTTNDGRTFSRDVDLSVDKENGSWHKDVTVTGPNGKSYSTSVDGQKTADGYTRDTLHTGPNGGTVTRHATVQHADGTRTKSVQVEGNPPQNGDATAQ